jgi:hypothetical protein
MNRKWHENYSGQSKISNITSKTPRRLVSLVGTLNLMLGVIVLANEKLPLKFCWTGAYMLLNTADCAAAALPQGLHWDLSVEVMKSVDWLRHGKAVPFTHKWDEWLAEAERAANTCGCPSGVVDSRFWRRDGSQKEVFVWNMPPVACWTVRAS